MARKKLAKNTKPSPSQKHFLERWLGRYLGGKAITLSQKGLGAGALGAGVMIFLALLSHDAGDPSLTTQSSAEIKNWLSYFGAIISDVLFSFVGQIPAYGVGVIFLLWGMAWLSPIENAKNKRAILKRLSLIHFLLFCAFLFFAGAIKIMGLLMWSRYIDNGVDMQNPQYATEYSLSVLENFWAQMLLPSLQTHALLPIIFFLSLVFLGLLLFLLSGLTFFEWQLLGGWCLSVLGFVGYALFYFVASVVGGLFTLVYRLLVMIWPMMKVFLPRPSTFMGQQALWKKIWQRLWHNIVSMPQIKVSEGEAPDHASLLRRSFTNQGEVEDETMVPSKPTAKHNRASSYKGKEFPPIEFLATHDASGPRHQKNKQEQEADAKQMAGRLHEALAQFGATGNITAVKMGPVITLYEFEPDVGIKNAQVISLAGDLARALSATAVRVAPIAGRNVLGIEVPNQTRDKVYLGELVASKLFQETNMVLPLILGKNIFGQAMVVDLSQMPHLLISGTTGSGKSVAMNGFLLSLLYSHTPDTLRLILIDPKMLELSIYQAIPHLLSPVVTDPKKAVLALLWATREMERRYKMLSELGVRNLADYRKKTANDTAAENLPYIVIMVDEMADLMLVMGKDVEVLVQRLAQMARAAGIHLIMATQRPSVDVITGTIKANFPTRLSYALPTRTDSRVILGSEGAEQLLGMGDFLIMSGGRIERGHAPFTTEEEVKKVTDWWRDQGEVDYLPTEDMQPAMSGRGVADDMMGGGEDIYQRAVELVRREKKASTSFLQRHLQIGYNRAATLMEQLEKNNVVSPPSHSGKREVL